MVLESAAPYEQLDWRWSKRYHELVHYNAYQWLTPAAFSPAEWEAWSHLQGQTPGAKHQKHMEQATIQSQDREILAALAEGSRTALPLPFSSDRGSDTQDTGTAGVGR